MDIRPSLDTEAGLIAAQATAYYPQLLVDGVYFIQFLVGLDLSEGGYVEADGAEDIVMGQVDVGFAAGLEAWQQGSFLLLSRSL